MPDDTRTPKNALGFYARLEYIGPQRRGVFEWDGHSWNDDGKRVPDAPKQQHFSLSVLPGTTHPGKVPPAEAIKAQGMVVCWGEKKETVPLWRVHWHRLPRMVEDPKEVLKPDPHAYLRGMDKPALFAEAKRAGCDVEGCFTGRQVMKRLFRFFHLRDEKANEVEDGA